MNLKKIVQNYKSLSGKQKFSVLFFLYFITAYAFVELAKNETVRNTVVYLVGIFIYLIVGLAIVFLVIFLLYGAYLLVRVIIGI